MPPSKSLSVELSGNLPADARATVAVGVFADEPRLPAHESLGGNLRALCERVAADGEFEGEEETTLLIHAPAEADGDKSRGVARRVPLVGLGSRAGFDAHVLRRAAGRAVRATHTRSL